MRKLNNCFKGRINEIYHKGFMQREKNTDKRKSAVHLKRRRQYLIIYTPKYSRIKYMTMKNGKNIDRKGSRT